MSIQAIHCIFHEEALCGKSLEGMNNFMIVVNAVNFIQSQALNHCQFESFLEGMNMSMVNYFITLMSAG